MSRTYEEFCKLMSAYNEADEKWTPIQKAHELLHSVNEDEIWEQRNAAANALYKYIAELEEENDRLQDAWFKDETICPDGSLKPKVSTLLSRIAELTECIGSQMADVYTLKARIAELEAAQKEALLLLPELERGHYYCDDCWYSCPKAVDGCCDESRGDECDCGADDYNALLAKIIGLLTPEVQE